MHCLVNSVHILTATLIIVTLDSVEPNVFAFHRIQLGIPQLAHVNAYLVHLHVM